jgi:hypothetical protein
MLESDPVPNCPICGSTAHVTRRSNDTYVNCTSGAEYLISHDMLKRLKPRSGALQRRHAAAKARKVGDLYVIMRLGTVPQEISEFQPRNAWL